MIIGNFPRFLDSSNSLWPFRGLFTQLPYIYNTPLKFEPTWLRIGCKLIENRLRTRLVGLPVLIGNHVMYGRSLSLLPMTFNHLRMGPQSVIRQASPFTAFLVHRRCFGFVWIG